MKPRVIASVAFKGDEEMASFTVALSTPLPPAMPLKPHHPMQALIQKTHSMS